MNSPLADPRRRNLAILAGIAVVTVLFAVLGVFHQESYSKRPDRPEHFFPDLLAHGGRQIAHIRIRSKQGLVDVVFKPEKTWVVTNKDDYPASFEQVRATVVALANLTALEKKTARADWYPYVDLVAPEQGGNGKEITILDDKGAVMASIITGKSVDKIGRASC